MKTAKLLLHCPDKPGILAAVTDFITINKGNIVYLDQYVDREEKEFFMRIEWELENFLIPQEKVEDYFDTLYAQKYDMKYRIYFSDRKPRMAIFVSKMSHCIYDLLARYTAGEWDVEIPLLVITQICSMWPTVLASHSMFSPSLKRIRPSKRLRRWNC